ncbi:hypothetical protein SPBRAN_702 [uncultured Candidatus Thioglobus sp.]|nr:hypothetical protein SPBRAN_702 [uncultured Candidatus Thioglobus sp.]
MRYLTFLPYLINKPSGVLRLAVFLCLLLNQNNKQQTNLSQRF